MKFLHRFIYLSWVNALFRPFAKIIYQLTGHELFSISGKIYFNLDKQSFVLNTNQTCYVTKHMYYNGLNSYEYNWLFKDLVKNANCFLDVGANIGLYSVMAAKMNDKLIIHAFEPGKGAVHFLRKNIKENNLGQIQIHELAMSNEDNTLQFHETAHPKFPWLSHNLNGSSSLQSTHGRQKPVIYNVGVCRLRTFLAQYNISNFDLIKLDTEHTEQFILADSLDIIRLHRPVIMIEIYPEIASEIQKIFEQIDAYVYFSLQQPKLKEISHNELGVNPKYVNYILMPDEKKHWMEAYCHS
jgi:FkbM family methyltransferase